MNYDTQQIPGKKNTHTKEKSPKKAPQWWGKRCIQIFDPIYPHTLGRGLEKIPGKSQPLKFCPSGIPTMVPKMAEEVKPGKKDQVPTILPDETDILYNAGIPAWKVSLPVTNKVLMSTL